MTIKIELPTTRKKLLQKNQKGYVENTQTDVLRKIRQKQKTKKNYKSLVHRSKCKEIRKLYTLRIRALKNLNILLRLDIFFKSNNIVIAFSLQISLTFYARATRCSNK